MLGAGILPGKWKTGLLDVQRRRKILRITGAPQYYSAARVWRFFSYPGLVTWLGIWKTGLLDVQRRRKILRITGARSIFRRPRARIFFLTYALGLLR